VQTWLAAAEISAGPVFRAVALGGRVSDVALADDGAARIVKRYAAAVGLDPAVYSGHSLRAGFLTGAAESGASVFKLAEVSRHKSLRRTRSVGRRGAHYGSKWCSRGARHDRQCEGQDISDG
jgi:hypothetical protein